MASSIFRHLMILLVFSSCVAPAGAQDSPILVPELTSEAQALRALGRNEEAAKVEQRIKTIQATAMNQD